MSEAWLNFTVVIFVQLLLFLACAYHQKRFSDVPRILGQRFFFIDTLLKK